MKKSKGKISILLGLLLIVAAFCLTGYDFRDEQRTAQYAQEAMVPAAAPLPDYVLNPVSMT